MIHLKDVPINLSNHDFNFHEYKDEIECSACLEIEDYCENCSVFEWENILETIEWISRSLQENGWETMFIPEWLGGWDNSVRGLKDPLLEVNAENLRNLIFPYNTDITSTLTMSGLPDQFEILVSHHDRPMGEKIIVNKGNEMQEM